MDENNRFYAHVSEDGLRKQSVKEHLLGTAGLAEKYAAEFGMSETGMIIGLLHDIGKYTRGFQKRLEGGPKVDHSSAGAYESFIRRMYGEAFCIAGHHGGLPNGGTKADIETSSLFARVNKVKNENVENYSAWKSEIEPLLSDSGMMQKDNKRSAMFAIRMLFSCLTDADYLDTEEFMSGFVKRSWITDIELLNQRFTSYIAGWYPPKNEINSLRCDILDQCIIKGSEGKSIYTLTVPTGGGKTVASLGFALKHAKQHGMSRIIYVIPYTSIIDQTASVFSDILGMENILEHHSNVQDEIDDEYIYKQKATENWDMPVIVTTAVQFFDSFYSNKPAKCRKLHNCANSVIVFDEAQMLPVQYIRPCMHVITELVSDYAATAVLCTATQPSLTPIIHEFVPSKEIREICPNNLYENSLFTRVQISNIGMKSSDELTDAISKKKQALVIVNSKKAAKLFYEKMEGNGNYYLSTNMYPKHRQKVLREIKERLIQGKECRVISTSLIEAGVDIDFPVVYRQLAGLDSILQAAGRCNREGKRSVEDSIVYIFECEIESPDIFSPQIAACSDIMKKYDNISCKEAVHDYFELLFKIKGRQYLDRHNIIQRIDEENFPFEDISEEFRLIGDTTKTVYICTAENEEDVEKLKNGSATRECYRRLQRYAVNVYDYQYQELKRKCAIEVTGSDDIIMVNSMYYSDEIGLDIEGTNTSLLIF